MKNKNKHHKRPKPVPCKKSEPKSTESKATELEIIDTEATLHAATEAKPAEVLAEEASQPSTGTTESSDNKEAEQQDSKEGSKEDSKDVELPVVSIDDLLNYPKNLKGESMSLFLSSPDFDRHLKRIAQIRDRTTSILDVLIPGHMSSRLLVMSLWESIYNNFSEEDKKRVSSSVDEFTSYAAGLQKLMSTQVSLENMEMKRLEFEKESRQMLQYFEYIDYFKKNPEEARKFLSVEAVESIENQLKFI